MTCKYMKVTPKIVGKMHRGVRHPRNAGKNVDERGNPREMVILMAIRKRAGWLHRTRWLVKTRGSRRRRDHAIA